MRTALGLGLLLLFSASPPSWAGDLPVEQDPSRIEPRFRLQESEAPQWETPGEARLSPVAHPF